MCKGWIMLDRQLQDHWLWDEKPYSKGQAWVDLLMLANWQEKKTLCKGKLVTCKRGDINLSLLALAERWGWSRGKVNRFLDLLESDNMVSSERTVNRTTITIENYSKYQDVQTADGIVDGAVHDTADSTTGGQLADSTRTTGGQLADTTNNINKYNKENKENNITNNNIPYGDIVETFNSLCPSLPRCAKLTDGRRKHIKARYKSYSLNDIETVFTKAEASDFLSGRSKTNWNATFDWLMKSDENFQKVLEGTYDNKTQYKAPRQTGGIDWDAI